MANSYLMFRRTFKWTMKLFFYLLDLIVQNSWILLSSCGAKCTHKDFRLLLVRNLIEEAGRSHYRPTPRLVWRQMLWGWTAAKTQKQCPLSHLYRVGPAKDHYTQMCQMWCGSVRGAVFRRLPHKNKFVKQFNYNNCECVCVVWWLKNDSRCHGT